MQSFFRSKTFSKGWNWGNLVSKGGKNPQLQKFSLKNLETVHTVIKGKVR